MTQSNTNFCGRTRREFLWETGAGFTGLALSGLLDADFLSGQAVAADGQKKFVNPLAPKDPHFDPKATSVIFLYMYGGPSHIDTFEYKPKMKGMDGKTVDVKTFGRGGRKSRGRIVETRWNFKQHGQCGQWVSDLFPHFSTCVDDVAFIHSMTADSPIHGSAMLMMNSGKIVSGSPCLGSWANYGLGTQNENLPGFVVMLDPRGGPISGAKNWSAGYMPASFQATIMRSQGTAILNLKRPSDFSDSMQRRLLDTLRAYNNEHQLRRIDNSDLAARIASYELAYRMQSSAPEATDLSKETKETQQAYGLDRKESSYFGRQCLLARRLVEAGVPFVNVYDYRQQGQNWDSHNQNFTEHKDRLLPAADKAYAALIEDLHERGLLESTLVVALGEFGRTPKINKNAGRDHWPDCYSITLAGGGIQGGSVFGASDQLGAYPALDPVTPADLAATIFWRFGLNPRAEVHDQAGRPHRLANGKPIKQIFG